MTTTISSYVAAWNESTPEAVSEALAECCSPGISYTDKSTPVLTGIPSMVNLIMQSHEKIPGRMFSVLTAPEYFDGQCYYSWGISIPTFGERAGRDFIEYDNDSRITRIVGFLPGT